MSRKLTIKAFKYNPLSKISKPHFVTYELEETPFMTVDELDIMKMEMPPAFRGYGAKGNIIENPLSEKRQAEVDAIREKMEAEGKNRHEIQHALMPYELQPKYKALNQRIGVDYE